MPSLTARLITVVTERPCAGLAEWWLTATVPAVTSAAAASPAAALVATAPTPAR